MKTISYTICILTIWGAFAAQGEDAPVAKDIAKASIGKASSAMLKVKQDSEEFSSLCKQELDEARGAGKPLTKKQKERLGQLWGGVKAAMELNRQVAELLKVGDSVFSYPGLLGLSNVVFNERQDKYSIRLAVAYKSQSEGLPRAYVKYCVFEFNEEGHITNIERSVPEYMLEYMRQ